MKRNKKTQQNKTKHHHNKKPQQQKQQKKLGKQKKKKKPIHICTKIKYKQTKKANPVFLAFWGLVHFFTFHAFLNNFIENTEYRK